MVSTTQPAVAGLSEFRDTMPPEKREKEIVGRSWRLAELRRKSFDDLHKLWYVLYKENNMLLTEEALCIRRAQPFIQPERRRKVKKSLGAIKIALAEREREQKGKKKRLPRYHWQRRWIKSNLLSNNIMDIEKTPILKRKELNPLSQSPE